MSHEEAMDILRGLMSLPFSESLFHCQISRIGQLNANVPPDVPGPMKIIANVVHAVVKFI
jgi:hypothetical protein